MNVLLTTYADLIDHITDYLGSNATGDAKRDARRAVQAGYRDLQNRHPWVYYYCRGRLATSAPYLTGTVDYDHTGGTYERQLTLSGGTWPTWAADGSVLINTVTYEVDQRKSDTVLTLTRMSNPGDDLTAQQYNLYRDNYVLPVDLLTTDRIVLINNAFEMFFEHPSSWLERQRIYHSPATPRTYTIRGAPGYTGALCLSLFPPPDNVYNFDFLYHRRARPLVLDSYTTGTVAVSNGLATVTGTGTSWTSKMIGSTLRISADGLNVPTGLAGSHSALYERVIMDVASATSLTADASFDQNLSAVKYVISDPVDIEEAAMLTALQRGCEYQVSLSRNMKSKNDADANYRKALIEAMEADSRSSASDQAGPRRGFPYRLAQMPRGADIS